MRIVMPMPELVFDARVGEVALWRVRVERLIVIAGDSSA